MRQVAWVSFFSGLVLFGVPACGGDDDGGGGGGSKGSAPKECEPATSFSCVGVNGCDGIQLCNSDGTWGFCSCGNYAGRGGSGQAGSGGEPDGGMAGGGDRGGRGGDAGAGAGAGGRGGDGGGGSSAAGSGSGGSDAGGGGSGGAGPQDEQCDNGLDDDDDGDVDCADDDCGERSCEREAPDGWQGPAVLFTSAPPDSCPSAFSDELARGGGSVSADPAVCDACTCTPETAGCATFLTYQMGADAACGGTTCAAAVTSSCTSLSSSCLMGLGTGYVKSTLSSGLPSCAPSEQTPSLPKPSWNDPQLACAATDLVRGGCAVGRLCAPPLPDGASLCVLHAGDVACPSGAYSEKTVFYTETQDGRGCSACTCDQDCSYTWNVYDTADTTCASDPLLSMDAPDQCRPVSPSAGAIRVGVDIAGTGACTPGGGAPQGAVAEDGAVTACCVP